MDRALARKVVSSSGHEWRADRLWSAMKNVHGEATVAAIDELIASLPPQIGSHLWHDRERVLGELVTEQCMARIHDQGT